MIRHLIGVLALACVCMFALTNDRSVAKDESKPTSMRFELRTEGPVEKCGSYCRVWVSAVGIITDDTARDFEKFAKANDVRGATMALDSEGGSVLAALALGRAVRHLQMTTTVSKTIPLPADADGTLRARLSPKASCESMCAFILLGGIRRYVPPEAHVLVHQIWLGSKSKRALESSYSAQELGTVQRDIGSLARYTVEMDGGIELLETALRVPPWEPMHVLTEDEIRRVRLSTIDHLFEPEGPVTTSSVRINGLTTVSHAQNDSD
jgi:hypothetical protein